MSKAWHARVRDVPKVTLSFQTGPGEYDDISVRLRENKNPAVRAQAGADAAELVLDADCSNPATLPTAIKPGHKAPLTLNGVEGTAKLLPTVDSRHAKAVRATGQRIRMIWSSTSGL